MACGPAGLRWDSSTTKRHAELTWTKIKHQKTAKCLNCIPPENKAPFLSQIGRKRTTCERNGALFSGGIQFKHFADFWCFIFVHVNSACLLVVEESHRSPAGPHAIEDFLA